MPIVNIPTVGNIQFPDNMSNEAISAAIKSNYPDLGKMPEQVSSGQVLAEENRPITKGIEAAQASASKGVLGTLAAPGAGLGEAAGTATQNILANIPGLGGAGGVIPAAGAALANAGGQLLGDKGVGGLLLGGVKKVAALPEAITNITKAGKLKSISSVLEQPATLAEQIATPLSGKVSALYKAAETQARVPTTDLTHKIFDTYMTEAGMANPNKAVKATLEGLYNKFSNSTGMSYSDVLNEVQRLRLTARGLIEKQPQAAKALNDAGEQLMGVLDSASPVARQAGLLARKNIVGKEILDTMLSPNAGTKVRRMLLEEPRNASLFGLDSPEKIDKFIGLVDRYAKPGAVNADTLKKIAIGSAGYYGLHKIYGTLFGGHSSSGY